jgi:hypothetical protein
LTYSTYLGGEIGGTQNLDQGFGITSAGPGVVAVSGEANSADFPVTPGAVDTTYNGEFDGFVAALQVARSMHVDRITPFYRPAGSGYAVGAAIRVLYADGSPVAGASVTVRITNPDGTDVVATRPTGSRGIAVAVRPASDSGTYTFTVLDVTLPGAVYDPAQNVETSDSVTIP